VAIEMNYGRNGLRISTEELEGVNERNGGKKTHRKDLKRKKNPHNIS
jgi:hypothetical protein